jgi:hypothetical protein
MDGISIRLVCGAFLLGGAVPAPGQCAENPAGDHPQLAAQNHPHPGFPPIGLPATVGTTASGYYRPPPNDRVDPKPKEPKVLQVMFPHAPSQIFPPD